jgi:hypothetical protein
MPNTICLERRPPLADGGLVFPNGPASPGVRRRARVPAAIALAVALLALLPAVGSAALDDPVAQWLPSSDGADWVYAWSDSAYSPTPRQEHFTVQSRSGPSFRLQWNEPKPPPDQTPSSGTMDFRNTDAGLVNLSYQSTQPPQEFPILCASPTSCGNSLAGTYHLLIWGTRSPTLAQPLLTGTRWSSLGGASNDVSSDNRYIGRQTVTVPAFPNGVTAAVVESSTTQAGALGDPYGSGTRTVYWVYGVGPVKIVFHHDGGETTTSDLQSTSLKPLPVPSDANYLPFVTGHSATFRWRNSHHMRHWSVQRFKVTQVVSNSARVDVKSVSGPIKVAGSYAFSTRLSGITNLSTYTKAASRAKFPKLGPSSAPPADRRHFFTPYDLMVYGFNPVVPVYANKGDIWRSSRDSRDFKVFGVTGASKVLGMRRVRTPAGRFTALAVTTRLKQRGFPFGSGKRTMYFAPNRGLVKLIFRHSDGSVSKVERVRR